MPATIVKEDEDVMRVDVVRIIPCPHDAADQHLQKIATTQTQSKMLGAIEIPIFNTHFFGNFHRQ